nr:gatC: aspartyl/glutamyl-tRNA(Asn/Gln) amidotransferase, C [uncultured bacterium]
MAQRLSEADVRRIAELARLELSAEEVELFSKQLTDILAYADALQQADTTGIAPTSHPLAATGVWRADEEVASLDRNVVVAAAPGASVHAGLFKVPKVL